MSDTLLELSASEREALPPDSRQKIDAILQKALKARQLEAELAKFNVAAEQETYELNQRLEEANRNLDTTLKQNEELRLRFEQIESARNERIRVLQEVEADRDRLSIQKGELQRDNDLQKSEKLELTSLISRKTQETETLQGENVTLKEQLKALTIEKCQTQIKLDEVQSRELALEYREKRWQQDKELIENEKSWYSAELRTREEQIYNLRKELSSKEVKHQTKLASCQDELSQIRFKLDDAEAKVSGQGAQIEELTQKLKEASDERTKLREDMEMELRSKDKLCEVYKESADTAEGKVVELTETLEKIQNLYEESKQSYFGIQEEMNHLRNEFRSELEQKQSQLASTEDELEKANELLRSKHRVMLTDEEVAALSPAAASASRLIKSGLSLTGIYRDHCKVVEELEQQRLENKRLEQYFQELVSDIEKKAPIMKQQRDDYIRTLDVCENLKAQLADVGNERQKLLAEKDAVARELAYTKAELERHQRDNHDLSAQVRQLLHVLERTRMAEAGDVDANDDLFLFRSIEDLQAKNQQLMSALREAEAKREEMIQAAHDAEMEKMKGELSTALSELESFKEHREKQNTVIQTICEQRDTYKRLLADTKSAEENVEKQVTVQSTAELAELQSRCERLSRDLDLYRNEKKESDKLYQSKIEQQYKELAELKRVNGKLEGDMEYHNQRFKILQRNDETHKKEVESLRERLAASQAQARATEERVNDATRELLDGRDQLARLRVENRSLTDQLYSAKGSERRLQSELEIVRKGSYNNEMLASTLQELQSRLQRVEEEKALKIQSTLDAVQKERDNLQAFVNNMTDQHRVYVGDTKAKLNALQTSLEEALSAKKATENKLEWTEKQLEDVKAHLDELNKQMNSVSSSGKDASAERFQKEAQQLKNRCNYMEMQYKELELKLAESNKQLEQRQKELEDMSKITGTIESSLKEQKDTDSAERDMLTSNISQLNIQLSTALGTIETLRAELSSVQQQLAGQQETSSLKELDWNEQKTALEKRLVVIQVEVDEWRGKHAAAFGDWERANQTVEELRQNYNEELEQLRATNFKLADMELLVQDKSNALTVALERVDALQAELDQQMATRGQSEMDMRTEIASLTERITDLQQKNDSLYEQLQKLGNEVAVLEKFSGEGPVSSDAAVDSTQSVQALNEVLHYLREEKQQAVQRADNSEAETKRLKSRVDLLESDFSALEVKLNAAERDAMAASEAMAEKAELTLRLQTLEGTQETNRQLTAQIDALNSNIAELVAKGAMLEERLSMADGERKSLQTQLTNAALDVEKMKTELSVWQTRHRELLEQQTQFGPDVVNELRTKLEAAERQASALQAELSRNTDELSKTKKQSDDHTDERDTIKSQLLDLRNQHEELTEKFAKNDQILDQARKLARKYKTQATQLEGTVKENETQIETQAKELAEIKAKLAETEKKLTETAAAGPSALPEADKITNPKVRQLVERLKAFETQQGNLKQTAQEMAKRAMDAIKEKREIEQKFNEAQKKIAELEDLVKNNEEQSMRLQSLTSLHQQCEPKIHQLEADVARLNEEKTAMQQRLNLLQQQQQLQQQKAAQIVQHVQPSQLMSAGSSTSSAAAVAQKRAIVRPGGNPSPNVASVRPISSQQRPQQPTAVSPSATQPQPDQSSSSSSSSTMAAQASVAPIVVSTTQYPAIVQPAVSSVPHAFVLPHVEYQQQQDVSGSGDSGAISSSNQPLDNNGEHSRKRALPSQSDDQSSETAKRLRASPMEQVSTSDQGPSHEDLEEEPDLVVEQGADSVETTYHDEERDSEEGAALSDDDAEDVEDRDDVEEVEEVIDDEQVEEDEGDDEMMEGEAEYDEDDDEQDEAELIGEDGQLVMERREPSLHQQDDDDDDIQIVDHVPAGGHRAMMAASSSSMGVGEGVGANEFDLQTVPPPMRGGMIQTHGGHDDRLLNVDDSIVPSTPTLMGARRPEIDITTAAVPQSSRFVFQLPQQDIGHSHPLRADLVTESGIQQSVPTSRDVSPVHVGVESDSTVGSLAAEHHGQQEEPQDQMVVEDELTDHGDDADDAAGGEQEEDIGAVEAEYLEPDEQDEGPVDERPSQTEDDSAEPSTSGQRIRIRKPIVWSNLGEESQPTSSSSEQLQGQPSGRGRGQQTARRATRARKSWQRPT